MTRTDDGLFVFQPGEGKGAQWFVRSVGGTHDPNPVMANALSKDVALRHARAMRTAPALR